MGLLFTLQEKEVITMNASIVEAKEVIKRPKNIGLGLMIFVLSAVCIYFFGYMQWRRIVIPIDIFIIGYIGLKISTQIYQAQFATVMRTASAGVMKFSVAILLGAIIDNVFFTDVGYVMFSAVAAMGVWIPFQLARLHWRLDEMPADKKKIVTDSSDMIFVVMAHREKGLKAALDQYYVTKKKLGLDDHLYIH